MTRLTLLLLCLVLLLATCAVTSGQSFSQAADKVRDAVITVTVDKASGTGFIVNPEGYALTNKHVVGEARSVTVKLRNGDELSAEVKETSPERDLCLLKLEADHLPAVQFASSAKLKQGDEVAAVGAPFGLPNSLSKGVVSSTEREIDGHKFIQIDAPLNQGNSGGPVINEQGQVIGVATKTAKNGQDLGFAIPSDEVMGFLGRADVAFGAALGDAPATAGEQHADEGEGKEPAAAPAPPAPAPAPAPSAFARPWALLAAAAVVAFVVALVTALLVAGRRPAVPAALQTPAQYGYPPQTQQPVAPGAAPRPAAPPAAPPQSEDLSDIDIQLR